MRNLDKQQKVENTALKSILVALGAQTPTLGKPAIMIMTYGFFNWIFNWIRGLCITLALLLLCLLLLILQ